MTRHTARCVVTQIMAGVLLDPVFAAVDAGELTMTESREFLQFLSRIRTDAESCCEGDAAEHVSQIVAQRRAA